MDSVSSGAGLKKIVGRPFAKGHPFYPPKKPLWNSEDERQKRKIVRALKMEFGPGLTATQKIYINNAADLAVTIANTSDAIIKGELIEEQRHVLAMLNE